MELLYLVDGRCNHDSAAREPGSDAEVKADVLAGNPPYGLDPRLGVWLVILHTQGYYYPLFNWRGDVKFQGGQCSRAIVGIATS